MKLKDKIVLVTGSSRGIGEATAKLLALEGATVVLNCKNNLQRGIKVLNEIEAAGGRALLWQADITQEAEVDRLFTGIQKRYGRLDILVNNAGAATPRPFAALSYVDWLREFNDNFFGAVLCSQRAAKLMLDNGGGKILNTSSVRGFESAGTPMMMAYSAAKAALNNFTRTLAKELAPHVQVNAVAPGYTDTDTFAHFPEEVKAQLTEQTVIKRFVQVEEVAEAFLYLATADAVTGEILVVDGGFMVQRA